jgi:hypothetical protein
LLKKKKIKIKGNTYIIEEKKKSIKKKKKKEVKYSIKNDNRKNKKLECIIANKRKILNNNNKYIHTVNILF